MKNQISFVCLFLSFFAIALSFPAKEDDAKDTCPAGLENLEDHDCKNFPEKHLCKGDEDCKAGKLCCPHPCGKKCMKNIKSNGEDDESEIEEEGVDLEELADVLEEEEGSVKTVTLTYEEIMNPELLDEAFENAEEHPETGGSYEIIPLSIELEQIEPVLLEALEEFDEETTEAGGSSGEDGASA